MTKSCYLCDCKASPKDYISLHKFPKDAQKRKVWKDACGLTDKDNVTWILLCSQHFDHRFLRTVTGRTSAKYMLIRGAIPSVNVPFPPAIQQINVLLRENLQTSAPSSFRAPSRKVLHYSFYTSTFKQDRPIVTDIQEANVASFETKIKVEQLEESVYSNELSEQIIWNKFNERVVKDEFSKSQSLGHEDIDIKTEEQEDQSSHIIFNGRQIKEEYVDEPQYVDCEDIDNDEEQVKDHSNSKNGDSTMGKKGKEYSCNDCSYRTTRKKHLDTHKIFHKKESASIYSCNQCSYQVFSNKRLQNHLKTHNCYVCSLCDKSFKEKRYLDAHYVFKHQDRSDEWRDIVTYKINECPKCDYKTVRVSEFKKHLVAHEPIVYKFTCSSCGFRCATKNVFTSHLRLHANQRPFFCTECDKSFKRKIKFDGHIISRHSNNTVLMSSVTNKIYSCDSCDYKGVCKTSLKLHQMSCKFNTASKTEFKFKCNVCEYKCLREDYFTRHMRIHVGPLPYSCTECEKSFDRKLQLDAHIVSRHSHSE